ncbi:MAG: hypothetical protein ABFR89_02705 [Actinomycetota bacterium]
MTTIWTIGYGDRSVEDIDRDLMVHGISTIVDVRRAPADPLVPRFDRRQLEIFAAQTDRGYRWMGLTLGEGAEYGLDDAIAELIALAAVARTVVICREVEPDKCHRSTMIAALLRDRDIRVVHILPGGVARPDEPHLPLER